MATELAADLDRDLLEAKEALHGQAETMLSLLHEFEIRIQARLDRAEARIAALREIVETDRMRPHRRG
jgi:hypothetical protein